MPTTQPESESLDTRRRYLRALIKVEQSEIDGGRFNGFPRKEKWQKEWLTDLRTELKELNAEDLERKKKSCSGSAENGMKMPGCTNYAIEPL